ncbi:MAG: HAMP domain-containing protein [Candidatus Omnitrophica bacterium]|nr:HAMP domain-containing protein [Candidatus Omnitrophota bacterium]
MKRALPYFVKRGLRFKVMVTIVTLFFLFTILLSGLLIDKFYSQVEGGLKRSLSRELQSMTYSISAALEFGDKVALQNSVRFFRESAMCRGVTIRDTKGVVIKEDFDRSKERLAGYPAMRLSQPVLSEDKRVIGQIEILYSLKEIQIELSDNVHNLLGIAAILSIFGLIFVGFFLNRFLGPLARLKTEIDRMVEKNFIGQVPVLGTDEISDLARSFNNMSDRLRITTVSRDELVVEVEQRRRLQKSLETTRDQLVQSEKMASIGQLAAGVAHEINNPSGFVGCNLEVLETYVQSYLKLAAFTKEMETAVKSGTMAEVVIVMERLKTYEESVNFDYIVEDSQKLLKQSRDGIDRIGRIVADLKTFSHENAQWQEEQVKVEDVLEMALSVSYNELKYRIDLRKEYGDTPLIFCNSQKMAQVLLNLLVNAAQAIPEKGVIGLKTYQNDKYVCVDVSDSGCGIPPENLKKIFDPFFTTKPVGKGTGLGLSISYELVKKQGGELRVSSVVGVGTTFTVMLPLAGKPEQTA